MKQPTLAYGHPIQGDSPSPRLSVGWLISPWVDTAIETIAGWLEPSRFTSPAFYLPSARTTTAALVGLLAILLVASLPLLWFRPRTRHQTDPRRRTTHRSTHGQRHQTIRKTAVIAILLSSYVFRALEWELFCRHDPGEDYPVIVASPNRREPAPPPIRPSSRPLRPTNSRQSDDRSWSPPRSCHPP